MKNMKEFRKGKKIERIVFLINMAAMSLPHNLTDYRVKFHTSQRENGSGTESTYEKNKRDFQNFDLMQQALTFYNLTIPFTEQTLKKKRKKLILRCHPDQTHRDRSIIPKDVNRYELS